MSRFDSMGIAGQSGSGAGGLGTKKTAMDYFVPVEEASPSPQTESMEADETLGHPFPTDVVPGTQHFEPTMAGKLRAAAAPRLLSPFLGDPATTVLSAGAAWQHLHDPFVSPTPRAVSLLMTRKDPDPADIVDLFWDAIGQEITLAVSPNDWIGFDASFVARALDEAQPSPTVTSDLTRRFGFWETKLLLTAPSVNGGAEAEIPVGDFSLTYGLDVPTDDNILGSRSLHKVAAGNRNASVEFTPKADLPSYYRRALAVEPEAFRLRLLAEGPIITGVHKLTVEVDVKRLFEITAEADISAGETLVGIPVTATAAFDAATSKFVTVRVINAVASYVPA